MNILIGNAWPYANGPLHLGRIAVLLPGDILARYHRMMGDDVIFLSGTDCYGSPIMESYRKLQEAGYQGSLEDYVRGNHVGQRKTLENYGISLDFFGASALGEAGTIHKCVSAKVFQTLYENGYIQ